MRETPQAGIPPNAAQKRFVVAGTIANDTYNNQIIFQHFVFMVKIIFAQQMFPFSGHFCVFFFRFDCVRRPDSFVLFGDERNARKAGLPFAWWVSCLIPIAQTKKKTTVEQLKKCTDPRRSVSVLANRISQPRFAQHNEYTMTVDEWVDWGARLMSKAPLIEMS